MNITLSTVTVVCLSSIVGLASAGDETVVVTFDNGAEGWMGPGGAGGSTVIDAEGGNPGANLHTIFDNFGITFFNQTNPAFVQDLAVHSQVTLGIDLKVEAITYLGKPVDRPWLLEIRDYDNPPQGYPYVAVWYLFDLVGESPWTTWSVTIEDPSAIELPPGWGGYGAEDPKTLEPILPPDRTFTDVLAGADEIAFTTLQPGYGFGFTDFDMRIDNVRIQTSSTPPCPGDLNDDGIVDGADLTILLGEWGPCPPVCPGDITGDGVVDGEDLTILLGDWGPCPT